MKKAIIQLGTSQHIVAVGDVVSVSIVVPEKDKITVPALAVIDDGKVSLGTPTLKESSVELSVENREARADKVTAVRYKAKKRVLKVRGHKQHLIELKVAKIS